MKEILRETRKIKNVCFGYDGIKNIINLDFAINTSPFEFEPYIKTFIDEKVYFGKPYTKFYSKIEAFAEELAKDYKIPCASCFFGFYGNIYYLLSESVYDPKKEEMYLLEDLLTKEGLEPDSCSLVDLWVFFSQFYPDYEEEFMEKLLNIYIFDALIANEDRHGGNLGVIKDKSTGELKFAKIFDQDKALKNRFGGHYSMPVYDKKDTQNQLYVFLKNNQSFIPRVMKSLWIIGKDNILSVYERLRLRGITFSLEEKIKIEEGFGKNLKMIKGVLERIQREEKDFSKKFC